MASIINASTSAGLISTADTSGILQLQTANTAALTINASQNVGIGTASPTQKLDVNGIVTTTPGIGSSGQYVISYGSGSASSRSWRLRNDSNAFGDFAIEQSTTQTGSTYATQFLINPSGNVGIGTGAPSNKLHVSSSSSFYTLVACTSAGTYAGDLYSSFTGGGTAVTMASYSDGASGYGVLGTTTNHNQTFITNNTEKMRLDTSGNLGIGTSSPNKTIDAKAANAKVYATSTTGTNDCHFGANNTGGSFYFGIDNSAGTEFGTAYGRAIYSTGAYPIIFYTNGAERARIDSSGNLLVGTTSAINSTHTFSKNAGGGNPFITVNTASSNPYGIQSRFSAVDPNNTLACYYEAFNAFTNTLRFEVRSNGGIANYSANNVNLSDRREKTNFAPATSYLDKICAIPVQTFNYIDQNMETDGGMTLGVVAQDVQAVAPELVMESNWAGKDAEPKMRLSIYQTDFQYALMKCIQEQQALIQSLKARLDAANL